MATQTLTFLFADIEGLTAGSAAVMQRPRDAYAGVAADYRWLLRTGLAAHGG